MRAIASLGLLALACAGTPEDGGPDAGMSNDITGMVMLIDTTDTGDVTYPAALETVTIAALVPDGSGGFTTYPGSGFSDGTFRIPDVPPGEYYLRLNPFFRRDIVLVTDLRVVDLRPRGWGRQVLAFPANQTNLVFNLMNLSPWQAGEDDLEFFSYGAAAYVVKIEEPGQFGTTGYPTEGATELPSMTVDYRATGQALIEGDQGDRAFLTQLIAKTAGSTSYLALARAIEFPSFTMQDGQTTTLTGAMTSVPQTQTLDLNIQRALWNNIETAVDPTGQLEAFEMQLVAGRIGITVPGGDMADLVRVNAPAGATDLNMALSYGDPFPVGRRRFLRVSVEYLTQKVTPDSTNLTLSVFQRATYALGSTGVAVAPTLGPVVNPTINGTSLFGDNMTGVGTSPTLAWSSPTLGTPTTTYVLLHRYDGGIDSTWIAILAAWGNSITIPPGMLQSGNWYWVQVQSYAKVNDPDVSIGLLDFTVPGASSDVASGFFTP